MVEVCTLDSNANVNTKSTTLVLLTLLEIICEPVKNTTKYVLQPWKKHIIWMVNKKTTQC
jgi:hypothetical protein